MTPEILLAVGLGIVATHATSLVKRFFPALSARETQLLVFGICFVGALIATIFMKYATPELLATLGAAFSTAVTWYEIVVKNHE